jgi:hypothetical protein
MTSPDDKPENPPEAKAESKFARGQSFTLHLTLKKQLVEKLKIMADTRGYSYNGFVRYLISEEWLRDLERKIASSPKPKAVITETTRREF